jgi:hypothetical protein
MVSGKEEGEREVLGCGLGLRGTGKVPRGCQDKLRCCDSKGITERDHSHVFSVFWLG